MNASTGSASQDAGARPAVVLATLWTGLLLLLTALWIQSPFTGAGTMFVGWSLLALPLAAWSYTRFEQWDIRQVPRGKGVISILAIVWVASAAMALSDVPGVMAMDGLILRNSRLHTTGQLLQWLPGIFGLTLSLAGLAAALEARYRLSETT